MSAAPNAIQQIIGQRGMDLSRMSAEMAQGDPFMEEIIRGQLSDYMGMRIPSLAERQFAARQQAIEEAKLQKEERALLVESTIGYLLDNKDAKAGEAFDGLAARVGLPAEFSDIPEFQAMSFEEMLKVGYSWKDERGEVQTIDGPRGEFDESMLQDPERLKAASRVIARHLGVQALELTQQDLLNYRFTSEAAGQTFEQRGAQRVQETAAAGRAADQVAQRIGEFVEGEGALAEDLDARLEAAEGEEGFDLTGFWNFLGDDWDTLGGARRGLGAIDGFLYGQLDTGGDRRLVVSSLLRAEQLERVRDEIRANTEVTPDGDLAPTNAVGTTYLEWVRNVSDYAGLGQGQALSLMGINDVRKIDESVLEVGIAGLKAAEGS